MTGILFAFIGPYLKLR